VLVDVLPPLGRARIDEVVRGKEQQLHPALGCRTREVGRVLERPVLRHVALEGRHFRDIISRQLLKLIEPLRAAVKSTKTDLAHIDSRQQPSD